MAILVANILFFIGYAFMYGGAAYFFKYLYLAPEATKLGVLAIGIGAMAFPPLWVAIARRFSKSITWVAGSALLSAARSEEHTSELQSLMRISYAVFCLKNKKTNL